jgi:peptidoglycan/xylan/chitin deacetylase (PgdA/CDA1 family)
MLNWHGCGNAVGAAQSVGNMFRQMLSRVVDPVGNFVLMSRAGDWGTGYRHGPRTEKLVALTFDDGPVLGGTEAVLEALDEGGAPGTFFCVGANIAMHPHIVQRAHAGGHVLGVHSMNHGRTGALSLTDVAHIDECVRELQAVIGRKAALYRPPWGWMTPWEAVRLRQRQLAIILWDIETRDWLVPCPDGAVMAAEALPLVQPGSIIVFHDGMTHATHHEKPETARAVRSLIAELRARDYRCVTIPDLLGIPAYQDEATSAPQAEGNLPAEGMTGGRA